MLPGDLRERLAATAGQHSAVALLVLHGSRARRDATERSDWDFAYLADRDVRPPVDRFAFLADLTDALRSDAVDLVDLRAASALLRFRVARDGVVVFERRDGAFREFQIEAAQFWCDIEPVVRRAHAAVFAELG